jgi:PAS domain S-box-containing protein
VETFFEELKRFVRFGPDDEDALRRFSVVAAPHYAAMADAFYSRLTEHPEARGVFSGPEQVERLKVSLRDWMRLLCEGPWDKAYFQKRARIGRIHVKIALPQRYMFGAMNLIRMELLHVAAAAFSGEEAVRVVAATEKILDIELAIMLETYREAFVDKVQAFERLEHRRLENALAMSEARYEEIVEKGEALIATTDAQGGILLFNRRCEELTGIPRADAVGRLWLELFVPATERHAVGHMSGEAVAGRRVAPFEAEIANGRRVRWHFTTLPDPLVPVLCTIGLDVTDEHEMAVRTHRSERLAALGTMAAGMAHEIRNPLNAAHLQLALVQRRLARAPNADVEGAAAAANLAASEMKRLALLVAEFLEFARPQPLRLARVDLRSTVETIVQLYGPEAAAIGVQVELAPGAAVAAHIDDERMKQVVLNLVKNAVEAAGPGGRVEVLAAEAGPAAIVEVVDTGPGLVSTDAPIFEPFYTTKEQGTGLGLAIVHRIVTDHKGRVTVARRAERTVFTVELPR